VQTISAVSANVKKALVIVPSGTISDSRCTDSLRDALQSAGYEVAVDLGFLEEQSDAHNILVRVREADLIVCEVTGRAAHVFYFLGLAHALGKRVLTLAGTPSDIPFCAIPGESLVCNPKEPRREETFSLELARAVRDLEASRPIPCGQRVAQDKKRPFIRWALSNEIKFNLSALERVRAKDLVFLGVWHTVDRGSVLIVTCETDAFESEDVQLAVEGQSVDSLGALKAVYEGFYKINRTGGIADNAVSVKTAQEYLQSVREFENSLMDTARELIEQLVAKGL
jgi:hypothetical protein